MPFITQCPHTDCSKFMLLEDAVQGTVVRCLVCKRPVQLDPPDGEVEDEVIELEATDAVIEKPTTPGFLVKNCPKCGTPLRITPDMLRQAVQCTECNFWGLIS